MFIQVFMHKGGIFMRKKFNLVDLDCANCAAKMEEASSKIDGVNFVSFSFITSQMILDADDEKFEEILNEIIKICKKIEPNCEIEL